MEKIKLTIIIPNYNGLRFLKDCIKSLENQTYKEYKLLVVDNDSTDGSREWLREKNIETLFLDKNYGFAGGCNRGLEIVNTPYVILLNNDTIVFSDYVENLLKAIDGEKNIFSVSALMINAYEKNLVDDAGDGLNLFGFAYQIGVGENIKYYNRKKEVFSACAGAAIYNMKILREIGFFDELHFAYLEDIDLGFRARLHSYKNLYEPSAKVYHLGSATSGSKYNSFKVKLAARNNIYLHYKNQSNLMLFINALPLTFGVFIKLIFFYRKSFVKDYIAGLKEAFKNLHNLKRQKFKDIPLKNKLIVELEMFLNTFDYLKHFIYRRLRK